jgi:hypothetical protein
MKTYVAHPEKLSSTLGGEEVVLSLDTGVYYGLNEVGTRIWSLLTEPRTLDDVCEVLEGEYDVDREVLEADAAALFEALDAEGLVQVIEQPQRDAAGATSA